MKQVTPSLLLTFMLCVLIGYFEPANAQTSPTASVSGTATANMVMFSTTTNSPFWPNPVGPGATVNIKSADVPTGGYLMSTIDGSQTQISILTTGQSLQDVAQTNQWFPVDAANNLYANNLTAALNQSASAIDTIGADSSATVQSTSLTDVAQTNQYFPVDAANNNGSGQAGVAQTNQWFPVDAIGNPITATVGNVAQTNQWFPVDAKGNPISVGQTGVAQTNQWFPVDMISNVANLDQNAVVTPTISTISLSSVPDGNYVLVITGQSGNTYTSNVVISSN